MSTIQSSSDHVIINADGSSKDIKFQANGVEVGSLSSSGVMTATSFAGSGANLTGISSVGGATGVDFNDNVKARFGTGNDLQLYHDGSDSFVLAENTSTLKIRNSAGNIELQPKTGEVGVKAIQDGSVELYHDNAIRLQTNATGIQLGMDGSLDGGIVSAVHSLFFNIDSDNNSSGQQIRFATNHNSGATGGNTLLSIQEDGRGLSEFTAKAWVVWTGGGTSINDSHNVSSITYLSTGVYEINYSNSLAGTDRYAINVTPSDKSGYWNNSIASIVDGESNASKTRILTMRSTTGGTENVDNIYAIVFGDN